MLLCVFHLLKHKNWGIPKILLKEKKKFLRNLICRFVITCALYKFHLGDLRFVWKTWIILNGSLCLVEPWKGNSHKYMGKLI